jgi:Macrocin-O-methyltransferase (TylF)
MDPIFLELNNFTAESGCCFRVEVPGTAGDSNDEPRRSQVQLLENGIVLGPSHSLHTEIAELGGGRYSHWGETLFFSTSDNSDPSTNGRRYALLLRPGVLPLRYRASAQRPGKGQQVLFDIDDVKPYRDRAFTAELPESQGDSDDEPHRSSLQLLENGIPLGPSHTSHTEIAERGSGRYSHWGETLFFSTSDNSDPNTNGRIYHGCFGFDTAQSSAATVAVQAIKALPTDYTPALAYSAIEECLDALYPEAALGDDQKTYWHNKAFVLDFRRLCGKDRRTMERKYTVYQLIKSLFWLSGDLAECGTYNGGTAYFMALAGREVERERPFHLFDSFAGLSPPIELDGTHWEAGALAIPMSELSSNLAGFSDIHVYPGWIPAQFHRVADRQFCFVHVDVDLHDPTRDAIEFFYPRLVPGGMILCDDYGSTYCPGARKAMDDFFAEKPERIIDLPTMQGLIIKRP